MSNPRISRSVRRLPIHAPVDAGLDVTAYYQAVRLFRSFLASRGRRGWEVAALDEMPGLTSAILGKFARGQEGPIEMTAMDIDTGREAPVLWDFRYYEDRDLIPTHAIYLLPELVILSFSLLDENWCSEKYLIAAPDLTKLHDAAIRLDDFRVAPQRDSDDYQVLTRQRIRIDRSLGWDDLILPEALKADVRGNLEGFLKGKAAYDRLKLTWKRGFLLVGPPGNGKTMLCRVMAAQAGVPCLYMLLSARNDRQDPMSEMFERARRLAPAMLVFEDIDSLLQNAGEMSKFLNLVDGFASNEGLLIVATTNHPEDVDPAILNRPSRFDRVWKIDNPDLACRTAYLARLFCGYLGAADLSRFARETEGFSVAYLKEVYVSSAQEALRVSPEAPIVASHVETAIARLRAQMDGAAKQFPNWIPMGFRSGEEADNS